MIFWLVKLFTVQLISYKSHTMYYCYSPLIYCLVLLIVAYIQVLVSGQHGYRRQMNIMRSMAQKAYEHGLKINEEAMCAKPRAELVYLTDSNKIYLPRATLLHRCSDLTGCCTHATHTCQPSQVENVSLYFFSITVQSLSRLRQNQNIERLSFINHTECACMPVDHSRSESLVRKSETNNTEDNPGTPLPIEFSTIVTNDNSVLDHRRRDIMYTGNVADSNAIDINNGLNDNSNTDDNNYGDDSRSNNILNYWGQMMDLYKNKAHLNIKDDISVEPKQWERSETVVNSNRPIAKKRTEIRRFDNIFDSTPSISHPLHYHSSMRLVPYQSQYRYIYPNTDTDSLYNLGKSKAISKTARYKIAFRQVN